MKDNVPLLIVQLTRILFFKGIPVDVAVNIFINSFGSIQETTMVRVRLNSCSIHGDFLAKLNFKLRIMNYKIEIIVVVSDIENSVNGVSD